MNSEVAVGVLDHYKNFISPWSGYPDLSGNPIAKVNPSEKEQKFHSRRWGAELSPQST